jgi:hypothetical protein
VSKFSDPAVELNLVLPFDDPVGALPISVPSALVRMMIELGRAVGRNGGA